MNPDIIMVGEARDITTANAIISAALTGHKVLSTIHTENTTSTLNRLFKMGVESFLVYESIDLIIAQRLVRISCPLCQKEYTPSESLIHQLKIPRTDLINYAFKRGTGSISKAKCERCDGTGYTGQTAIHEILSLNSDVSRAIADGKSIWEVREIAIKRAGMVTLREDCLYKIHLSITTIEECLRVTPDLDEPSRILKIIIGLSQNTSDFAPCDYGIIEFDEQITRFARNNIKNRLPLEIEKELLTRLNESGLKARKIFTFSLSALDEERDREFKNTLKQYINQDRHCYQPLEDNSRCQQCNKAKNIIMPLLKTHSSSLSEIVIISDDQQSFIFSNRPKDNRAEWKLLLTEPLVQGIEY